MKKSILAIITVLVALGSFMLAPASYAFYEYYPKNNTQFDPKSTDYYDGNLRLQLKTRADIERASAPNRHYDKYTGEYYWCDWKYNTNLGTWVCNKSAEKYSPDSEIQTNTPQTYIQAPAPVTQIQACPYGYVYKTATQGCAPITVPKNAVLSAGGNGWDCKIGYQINSARTACELSTSSYVASSGTQYEVTRYAYYYNNDSTTEVATVTKPVKLPSTGSGLGWTLISGLIGTLAYAGRKIYRVI
jgi:hypothetical protein